MDSKYRRDFIRRGLASGRTYGDLMRELHAPAQQPSGLGGDAGQYLQRERAPVFQGGNPEQFLDRRRVPVFQGDPSQFLQRLADGGPVMADYSESVVMTEQPRMKVRDKRNKIRAYTSRGMEPPPELLAAEEDMEQTAESRGAQTIFPELTGVPSVMRGSSNIAEGIESGDGLQTAKGVGEVVIGAAPGLGALGRAGMGAASRVGGKIADTFYGSLPRVAATTGATMAPGVLDSARAEAQADYERVGRVGSEPSLLDAAKRMFAGRDFTPVSDEDFRRQYETRNPMPRRMTEQEYVDDQVSRFQESPGYKELIALKAVTRANNQARDVAAKAAADYRRNYGEQFRQQVSDWDKMFGDERQRYLTTLNEERLAYQKKPFAERNPSINALTYVVPAAIAAQRYGAKINKDAADIRRLTQIAEDSSQPVATRIAAQKDLADVLKKTPQTGMAKTLQGAKYGAGGGALSVLMGTGQDLADTFYLDPDSEARKRAAMKFVPIDDEGNTDFGPMKDMLKNNAQRMAIMAGAVGSTPLFRSGLTTAETTAANRVARGPDLFDMDARRAALAKASEIDRRGMADQIIDETARRTMRRDADALRRNERGLDAASAVDRDREIRKLRALRTAQRDAKPTQEWVEEQQRKMFPTSPTNLQQTTVTPPNPQPPKPPKAKNNQPNIPQTGGSVNLDSAGMKAALSAVAGPTQARLKSDPAAADQKLRSIISMQLGKPKNQITQDEMDTARSIFGEWASGKADGGAVARANRAMSRHWEKQNRYARGGTVHRKGMFKRGMREG